MTTINFETLRIGDLVQCTYGERYSWERTQYYTNVPLRVTQKVIRKKSRNKWDASVPYEMVEVQSVRHHRKKRFFYMDEILIPTIDLEYWYKIDKANWSIRTKEWIREIEKDQQLANGWEKIWSPPPPKIRYKPRRTSYEVVQDKAAKKWRKEVIAMNDAREG